MCIALSGIACPKFLSSGWGAFINRICYYQILIDIRIIASQLLLKYSYTGLPKHLMTYFQVARTTISIVEATSIIPSVRLCQINVVMGNVLMSGWNQTYVGTGRQVVRQYKRVEIVVFGCRLFLNASRKWLLRLTLLSLSAF